MGQLDPKLECALHVSSPDLRKLNLWSLRKRVIEPAELIESKRSVELLDSVESAEAVTRVIIRLSSSASYKRLKALPGIRIRSRLDELITAEVTHVGLTALRDSPDVLFVESARPLLPSAEFANKKPPKIDLPTTPLNEKGRGVIVGVVDWGCDFTHDDFRNDDGTTRLISLWDQSASTDLSNRAPHGYSSGVEFDSTRINAALSSGDPYASLNIPPPGAGAHGTHVLGIAAGNGRGDLALNILSMASESDIIFVQPDTSDIDIYGGFGDSVHLVEAVKYIFDKASSLGKPAVINLSMGTNAGPHDGSTLVEQWIDRLLGVPGRAIVLALGNEHHERYNRTHSEGRLATGEETTLYWRVLAGDHSPNEIEVWFSGRDLFEFSIELPDGTIFSSVSPGESRVDVSSGGSFQVFQSSLLHSPLNGDNQFNLIAVPKNGSTVPAGVWKLHIKAIQARDCEFDAWIERDSMQGGSRISSFLGGSYVRRKTLGSIQSAHLAITVSNYDSTTTTLADSTSFGPTRDGRRAPTVAAPGVDIMAANSMWRTAEGSHSPYVSMTGTSMSAPFITSLIACMLEKNPNLTATQIRGIIAAHAKAAPGFGDEWRIDWGHGRADPIDTLAATPASAFVKEAITKIFSRPETFLNVDTGLCESTAPHVEGPFYRPGAPACVDIYPNDSHGPVLYFEGGVANTDCAALSGVKVEIWQSDENGHYDNDDPTNQPAPEKFRCRAQLITDDSGCFRVRTVLPANYKVAHDSDWVRVKHLHFKFYAHGYEPLTTEIALMPDEFAATDHLFNSTLTCTLSECDYENGLQAWKSNFRFILRPVSIGNYASSLNNGI